MVKLSRRRSTRFPANIEKKVAVYAGVRRMEGRVIEESVAGLSALFSDDCELEERQKVQVIFRRVRRAATVIYVSSAKNGVHVGLALEGCR